MKPAFLKSNPKQWRWRSPILIFLWIVSAIASVLLQSSLLSAAPFPLPASQYSSTIQAPFNQPGDYPPTAQPPPAYRPVSEWSGRLILPTAEQYAQVTQAVQETDWAWLEVSTAPPEAADWVGKVVRLAWVPTAIAQAYVKTASRDVHMAPDVQKSWDQGIIHPVRLNERQQVGPLQSVAGGHPYDDVTVVLRGNVTLEPQTLTTPQDALALPTPQTITTLRINREPLQSSGRFVALVKFVELVPPPSPDALPSQCPGMQPCASDRMRVKHYNPATGQFDGAEEIIRIPQQPADWQGIYNLSTRELDQSPAGSAGWYIYGAPDKTGLFTVQAMQPRSLMQLKPQQLVTGFNQGLRYINYDNWKAVADKKGTLQTVLVHTTATTPKDAEAEWQEGDRALVIHLYGGRGGTQPHSESFVFGTYAGHFSFGLGQVVRDPFTDKLIFEVDYLQVYGNGSDGTLSGPQTWAHYMGNLRRGVVSTRPISDVLIKLDALTEDYVFGDTKLSFFNELLAELSLVGARYRIGDGSGDSTITSATSCVQDSAQALFTTLRRFKQKIESNPQVVQWMKEHPDDLTTQRFLRLVDLSKDLANQLMPMGVVRWDWVQNSDILVGVRSDRQFISIDNFQLKHLLTGLISWRTALPRQAHDEFAMVFLRHGAALWFLRPNQINGIDPGIAPLEPTLLLGAWKLPFSQIPPLSYVVLRTFGGVTIPTHADWLKTLGILLGLGAIALPIGFSRQFLVWQPWKAPWYRQVGVVLRLLLVPALVEEYLFRVLLVPYPQNWFPAGVWWAWALLSLGLYVGYHGLLGKVFPQRFKAIASNPTFLLLVTLLGIACTLTYRMTGSLWTITLIHWIAVIVWWLLLGGKQQLHATQPSSSSEVIPV